MFNLYQTPTTRLSKHYFFRQLSQLSPEWFALSSTGIVHSEMACNGVCLHPPIGVLAEPIICGNLTWARNHFSKRSLGGHLVYFDRIALVVDVLKIGEIGK